MEQDCGNVNLDDAGDNGANVGYAEAAASGVSAQPISLNRIEREQQTANAATIV